MKKSVLFIVICLTIFMACSENPNETGDYSNNQELITKGLSFAKIHNDCVNSVYAFLAGNKANTRASSSTLITEEDIINSVNSYIRCHVSKTRTSLDSVSFISADNYKDVSIEDLKSVLDSNEWKYVNTFLENTDKNEEHLLEIIANDNKLTIEKRQAVITFITTYIASAQYWQENYDKWIKLSGDEIHANTRASRTHFANWKEIAFADAYWGYTGLLSSGLNLWVGGGAAAAGSILSALK